MEFTKSKRDNLTKILINVGSITFGALVISNFAGEFKLGRFVLGIIATVATFGPIFLIEEGE